MSIKYKTFLICDNASCNRAHVGVVMDKPSAMFAKLNAESTGWLVIRGKDGKPQEHYCPTCVMANTAKAGTP